MTPHEQDMTELVDRLRKRLENWAAESVKQAGEIGDMKRTLADVEAERNNLRARLTGAAIHANRVRNCIFPDTPAGVALADLFAALEAPAQATTESTEEKTDEG